MISVQIAETVDLDSEERKRIKKGAEDLSRTVYQQRELFLQVFFGRIQQLSQCPFSLPSFE
jgi:hypothetical protein